MAPIPAANRPSGLSTAEPESAPLGASLPTLRASTQRLLVFLISLALLHLTNPLVWEPFTTPIWFPPAGLGLALIAWFGSRAVLWLALEGMLIVVQTLLMSVWLSRPVPNAALGLMAVDALLGAGLLFGAWRLCRSRALAAHDLRTPRSTGRFLLLLPGLGVGAWAGLHTLLFVLVTTQSSQSWRTELPIFWLSRALGVMILTPLLLLLLTPWLRQRGLVRSEVEQCETVEPLEAVGERERVYRGDALELLILSVGAGLLTWLAMQNTRTRMDNWYPWGAPLLLILCASLRQGLRGALLVVAVSAGWPFLLSQGESLPINFTLRVQGNLLGQCLVAVLVAVVADWVRIRESRYRQLAGHLPVVLYSARFRRPQQPPLTACALDAEVTLVSAASARVLGCPPRTLLGEHDRRMALVHPDDREVLRAAIVQLGRQIQPVTCEYRLAPSSGQAIRNEMPVFGFRPSDCSRGERWVRDTLAPRLDREGRLIGWEGVLTDITEQRILADDLRRTTSMLHALVGNLPAGVFFVQAPLGQPILVNARARQLLGQREDLSAGLDHLPQVYRLHRPDGTPYPLEELPVFLALRKGLTTMRDDIVVHRPDGRRTPLVTWAAPVRFPTSDLHRSLQATNKPDRAEFAAEGEWGAAVWVMEDLTALQQAEAARRDSESRLHVIVETMAEGIVVYDDTGSILECNTAASSLFGQPPEQLRGKALVDCDFGLMGEDGTLVEAEDYPFATVLRFGRPVRNRILSIVPRRVRMGADGQDTSPIEKAEARTASPFKDARWVLVNAMPLATSADTNRAAAGVVVTYTDITTTLRAQRMMRESEEKYRDLVESLPLMVVQADLDMRVTYTNAATRATTGYELDEIAEPAAWGRMIHPEDIPLLQKLAYDGREGKSGRAEFRYCTKDGSNKVGLAFTEPQRRSDGLIVGTTTLVADITRERQLELDLLRAQRLELVGRISSGIAHDFNNLLSVVLSLTELITTSLPANHAAQADLRHIQNATEQAANLANQLLTFSKQRRSTIRRLDLNQAIKRTLNLLRASLPSRIVLQTELAEQALFVQADETQMQQVLMNLCINARDAMPDGGRILVRTVSISAEGDWVCLSVADEGVGISEAVRAHLFDPFFSTKERGTGLGLAVVRQIVESHGGRVIASGEVGHGACFEVRLPASH